MRHLQRLSFFTFLLIAVSLAGCSSGGKLRSDYDHTVDFSQYKTWNFMQDAGPDYDGYQSLFTTYMLEAIEIEMNSRGYQKSENPDLLVNFNVMIQDKTKVTTSPSMGGSYYGYRGSRYGAWGGYGYGTDTHVSQYTEGTFNIDLVDARKKQLVWEAVGIGRINDKLKDELEERVREGVPKFFDLYPYIAGSGMHVQPEK